MANVPFSFPPWRGFIKPIRTGSRPVIDDPIRLLLVAAAPLVRREFVLRAEPSFLAALFAVTIRSGGSTAGAFALQHSAAAMSDARYGW